jgi:hypothetical protein
MAKIKLTEKEIHIGRLYCYAKKRAAKDNLQFDITLKFLRTIAPDVCPILKLKLHWAEAKSGKGRALPNSPTLDKIKPELGYTVGNVAFISSKANHIKAHGTMEEHYAIADWIWDNTNDNKTKPTPVSNEHLGES